MESIPPNRIPPHVQCCSAEAAWAWTLCLAELALDGLIEAEALANAVEHFIRARQAVAT